MTMTLEQAISYCDGSPFGTDSRLLDAWMVIRSHLSQPQPVAQGEVVDVEGDYDWRKGPIEFEDSDGVKWYGYPRPTSPTREAVVGLECPGITSWNSFCKNCKPPAHVCFDTNCNGSGSGYEAVGNITHKCKCGPTIPTGHRVVPEVDEHGLAFVDGIGWVVQCPRAVEYVNILRSAAPDAGVV